MSESITPHTDKVVARLVNGEIRALRSRRSLCQGEIAELRVAAKRDAATAGEAYAWLRTDVPPPKVTLAKLCGQWGLYAF